MRRGNDRWATEPEGKDPFYRAGCLFFSRSDLWSRREIVRWTTEPASSTGWRPYSTVVVCIHIIVKSIFMVIVRCIFIVIGVLMSTIKYSAIRVFPLSIFTHLQRISFLGVKEEKLLYFYMYVLGNVFLFSWKCISTFLEMNFHVFGNIFLDVRKDKSGLIYFYVHCSHSSLQYLTMKSLIVGPSQHV